MISLIKFIKHYINPRSTFLGLSIFLFFISFGLYFLFKNYFCILLNPAIFWPTALGASGFILIKFLETRSKRYNTLCDLEIELSQASDALSLIISTLEHSINILIPILLPRDPLYLTIEHIKQVGRIDLKNNLSTLLCDFRRINHDWNIVMIEYGKAHSHKINNPTHPEHEYAKSYGTEILKTILNRSKTALNLVIESQALVRLYTKHDKSFFYFNQPFIWPSVFNSTLEKEKKMLKSEIKKQ